MDRVRNNSSSARHHYLPFAIDKGHVAAELAEEVFVNEDSDEHNASKLAIGKVSADRFFVRTSRVLFCDQLPRAQLKPAGPATVQSGFIWPGQEWDQLRTVVEVYSRSAALQKLD